MLFGRIFEDYGLLAWLRRLRERRLEAYGVALLAVALATLLRFPLAELLAGAAPFTTYSLAIIVVALVCGFWPGMMAVSDRTSAGDYDTANAAAVRRA